MGEEHWHKVHKRHCKYFSGKKPLEESDLHKKETCGRCIKQEAAGRKVFKEGNPTYVCPYDPNLNSSNFAKVNSFLQDKYPMPSRESPSSRFERTLDVLQSILLKIKVTKQPIFRLYPTEVELIADELEKLRTVIFHYAAVYPSNYPFFAADEAVHAVCCKNKQEVDKRKVKIGGKAKARMVNQNLEAYRVKTRQEIQNANFNEETSKLM